MKTKQPKEESDKTIDEDVIEPKTRARKKASDLVEEDKQKAGQDDPKPSKETKKTVPKPRAVVKKRPLGIRKARTLKNKKGIPAKKNALKKVATRGRKAGVKVETEVNTEKETVPLIPASEIKKEPVEDTTPSSRSSSPKTTGRRPRLTSDIIMMKSVLADAPNNLILGPRTSPYSMRSERSNSPSLFDGKNLRSGKPRKAKNNLLNEVVIKEQKKRRLLSDTKLEAIETPEDSKRLKRGRSCSRDGSEISKCSDVTESDASLSETINDSESKELNKNIDNLKTDVDIDIATNVQISSIGKVPSPTDEPTLSENKADTSTITKEKENKSLSLKSTSLDSENNNSNRLKLENLNVAELEDKYVLKTENDALFEERSSILTSMSKTFNSKEVSKNIRKARRGKKAAVATKVTSTPIAKNGIPPSIPNDELEEKPDTVDSLSKEISDLINDLDQNINQDQQNLKNSTLISEHPQTRTVSSFYGLSKPLGDNNSIPAPETPIKEKDKLAVNNECTPSKNDDCENIRLHYEEDSAEKSYENRPEITCAATSIDKLMDRLKEFEEFDKRRQRQESESKTNENKSVMVTNDVVLIHKSGADIKPFKDMQSVKSPERVIEKENVLSCFENNSAISIVKRDQMRRSTDVDLPNTITLIKRNSVSARKESTSSNHSKESDAISIFEKSLGKDVTLTEIKKSMDKPATPAPQVDLHQFATLHPTNTNQTIAMFDSHQISITPRSIDKLNSSDVQLTKRKSSLSLTRKSSDSSSESDKMATIEKIKSPPHQIIFKGIPVTSTPVAIKSPEALQSVEIEALPPPMETDKPAPENTSLTLEVPKVDSQLPDNSNIEKIEDIKDQLPDADIKDVEIKEDIDQVTKEVDKMEVEESAEQVENKPDVLPEKIETADETDKGAAEVDEKKDEVKPEVKPTEKPVRNAKSKSTRHSLEEELPGPSNLLQETPESQKRKENVLRTLGLVTHKAANEERIDRQKEKKRLYGNNYPNILKGKSGKSDYTGTLKTVIKLSRGSGDKDKRKYTSSLKMTFQKSKNRSGKPPQEVGAQSGVEDAYYTIERREGGAGTSTEGGHRKTHYSNRLNNHDVEAAPEPEPETLNLVIPEKASSFSIHPGRLCMDQCFYCGGKFGLFDTPCHIAQMKSGERQRKVLDNEEKLTIDSCLCDACYRHVDRRANCPSYRKRPLGKPAADAGDASTAPAKHTAPTAKDSPLDSEEESGAGRRAACHTSGCGAPADHSIRRKWLIKMRASVNSILKLEGDYPGLHTIPLCGEHYRALAPLRACALCRRRLTKHHNLQAPQQNPGDLNGLLQEAQIPADLPEKALLCKWCRCFCSLLQRPTQDKHTRAYRRKLLQIYNVEIPPELEQVGDETNILKDCNSGANKQKKKARNKSKQRKSTDNNSESSNKSPSESEKDKKEEVVYDSNNVINANAESNLDTAITNNALNETDNTKEPNQPIEEDIESLISSNKIPVPGAMSLENNSQSDSSETDMLSDPDTPMLPLDKQTELRYLLQKQNNPAQFQQIGNLTQKQKNILKVQTVGIQKPGQQHRINEKNTKKIQKLGQIILQKDKFAKKDEADKVKEMTVMRNIPLNEECTIETIPNKKPTDINTLKNKWQMSESFTQVKKNLTELSKKTVENPKKTVEGKYSNPVKRLETNPSISVRELFPGEEEMSLQCNIDFNNVKGVTPEGWEKCNSMIQYDNETKRLWTELQRPYGNQSSFLRHLILLEKYFRSGDLVLSHSASPHAANYSCSVQNRLRAYDNVPQEAPKRDSVSLLEYRKKPSMNGKSLLKSNQTPEDKDPKKFMPPPSLPKPKNKTDKKSKALPPELIAINTPNAAGRKSINNVLQNIQQLVKDVSASDPTVIAAAPLPANTQPKEKKEMPALKYDPPKEKKEMPGLKMDQGKDRKVRSPKPDSKDKKDKKETPKKNESKGWRPTLMPITPENLARIAREPLKTSVDGHSLPSLVQVLSSGVRYHITFEDYNKMALIRKERRKKRFEDKEAKMRRSTDDNTVVTEILPSTMLGNGGTLVQNLTPDAEKKESELQMTSNAATILKNVGLKNITIAPITPKTATVTSQTLSPAISSPSLLVTTPIKIPQFGPAVSITSETVLTPNIPIMTTNQMILPKIPKSLTVIPQTVVPSQAVIMPIASTAPSQAVMLDRP